MPRKLRTAGPEHLDRVESAVAGLRRARDLLVLAGCPAAARAVRKALKSAEGARRHALRRAEHAPDPQLRFRYVVEAGEPRGANCIAAHRLCGD